MPLNGWECGRRVEADGLSERLQEEIRKALLDDNVAGIDDWVDYLALQLTKLHRTEPDGESRHSFPDRHNLNGQELGWGGSSRGWAMGGVAALQG